MAHKEKSVLQAKLTKLAIQIGYAGDVTFTTLLPLSCTVTFSVSCVSLTNKKSHMRLTIDRY